MTYVFNQLAHIFYFCHDLCVTILAFHAFLKMLGCFNPILGQILTNSNNVLKMLFKHVTQWLDLSIFLDLPKPNARKKMIVLIIIMTLKVENDFLS